MSIERILDGASSVIFKTTTPDGTPVAVHVEPREGTTDDGCWQFSVVLFNGPPRGTSKEVVWVVSKRVNKPYDQEEDNDA